MHLVIPHKTTAAAAVKRVKDGLSENRTQIDQNATITEERWEGDTFHFGVEVQGKVITGTPEVTDTDFVLDAKLPLLWRMFEGRIEKEIEKQIKGV
jgi:hypothetical protein